MTPGAVRENLALLLFPGKLCHWACTLACSVQQQCTAAEVAATAESAWEKQRKCTNSASSSRTSRTSRTSNCTKRTISVVAAFSPSWSSLCSELSGFGSSPLLSGPMPSLVAERRPTQLPPSSSSGYLCQQVQPTRIRVHSLSEDPADRQCRPVLKTGRWGKSAICRRVSTSTNGWTVE